MKIYTRTGDDGTTGMLFGGRVPKDAPAPSACGDVDEAQAALGLARTVAERGSELDALIVAAQRDLWVVMAELATASANHHKLDPGRSQVDLAMVERLESDIDDLSGRVPLPTEFVIPGQTPAAAFLDYARTVVRRAERRALSAAAPHSLVVPYLNRLSDLLWTMARWQEGPPLPARAEE